MRCMAGRIRGRQNPSINVFDDFFVTAADAVPATLALLGAGLLGLGAARRRCSHAPRVDVLPRVWATWLSALISYLLVMSAARRSRQVGNE